MSELLRNLAIWFALVLLPSFVYAQGTDRSEIRAHAEFSALLEEGEEDE
jgi:hypothetical protein